MMMQCQPQASQKFKTGQDFLEIFRPKIPQLAESYMEPLSLPAQNEGKRKGKNKKMLFGASQCNGRKQVVVFSF